MDEKEHRVAIAIKKAILLSQGCYLDGDDVILARAKVSNAELVIVRAAIKATNDEMDVRLREAAHHLIWVWFQYGGGRRDGGGRVYLPHNCMGAGEDAADFLADLNFGIDQGTEVELTSEGRNLLDHFEAMSEI